MSLEGAISVLTCWWREGGRCHETLTYDIISDLKIVSLTTDVGKLGSANFFPSHCGQPLLCAMMLGMWVCGTVFVCVCVCLSILTFPATLLMHAYILLLDAAAHYLPWFHDEVVACLISSVIRGGIEFVRSADLSSLAKIFIMSSTFV